MRNLLDALDRFLGQAQAMRRERKISGYVAELQAEMQTVFWLQGGAFVKRLAELRDKFPMSEAEPALPDWEGVWYEAAGVADYIFLKALERYVGASLIAGAGDTIGAMRLNVTFDATNTRALAYIRAHGAELVKGVNETTRETLRGILSKAMESGWSYDTTAKAITDRFEEFAVGRPQQHIDSRAHLIAVTEAGNAYEAGSYMPIAEMQDAGMVMEKYWLTTHQAERNCEQCAGNEDEEWILADRMHQSGHMHPMAHPACLCTELYRRRGAEEG